MKYNPVALGASASVVCVLAVPVAAAVQEGGAESLPPGAEATVGALERSDAVSDASLAGTAAAFLLVGAATLSVAHRRRWRTIDLRDDATIDLRDSTIDARDRTPRKTDT